MPQARQKSSKLPAFAVAVELHDCMMVGLRIGRLVSAILAA